MLKDLRNYKDDLPKLGSNASIFRWSTLFLYDLLFNITSSKKNEQGSILKKFESNTSVGRRMNKIHDANVKKMLLKNQDHVFDGPLDLPSIAAEDFNREDFVHWKSKVGKPIVIKGYLKGAPILDLMSLDTLTNEYGSTEVKCTTDVADSDKESRVGQNLESVTTNMKDFLTSKEFEDYYINNFFGVLTETDFLNLCKGKEIDEIQGQSNILTQWFISRTDRSGSTLHCASADNMFLNIKGRKEWHFIDPSYTPIMQPAMSKHGIFAISEMDESLDDEFYDVMTQKYAHMKHVPIYKVVLEEGDLLYNPPWWWHRVKNMSDFTVGCATRYWEANKSLSNSFTLFMGMQVESIKNPKKSPILLSIKSLKKRDHAKEYIDSIFSKGTGAKN